MVTQVKKSIKFIISFLLLILVMQTSCNSRSPLEQGFLNPPDSSRPGVYWYFMDGNLSKEAITKDLEAMRRAGIGYVIFLEVNVGIPRGPVDFLSDEWQDIFGHLVAECERIGINITLGVGPGWTGSGGPWVEASQSMQHLVATSVEVSGAGKQIIQLPQPIPKRPFFGEGNFTPEVKRQWEEFYADVAVLAFPADASTIGTDYVVGNEYFLITEIEEKAIYYRKPYSSAQNVKRYLTFSDSLADERPVDKDKIIDLTALMHPDGTLEWDVPSGRWTVMRFGSRNNGAVTRPAPLPGVGLECDKFDTLALNAHLEKFTGKLFEHIGFKGALSQGGLQMLHMDSWEMGAQNWSPFFREEFTRRRGYDPLPFYPVYAGIMVQSHEASERFLWDLRQTAQELVMENHAGQIKRYAKRYGMGLSIEPYDMNPTADLELASVADMPMCEFWSVYYGFNTSFSAMEGTSVSHLIGQPVVPAESFTAEGDGWRQHPGSMKNQTDWAFAAGINRLVYHTFQHQYLDDKLRPGMTMGPYGVHWDRNQTWWPMADAYHRYVARSQFMLQQGRTVADILYLTPEGAPHVFRAPASALEGEMLDAGSRLSFRDETPLPDRKGYNFDGCPPSLLYQATVRDGQVVFPGGASYRLLVLPCFDTMTPALLRKISELVHNGATVVGLPPVKSPSLNNYPVCDMEIKELVQELWGTTETPDVLTTRIAGKGKIIWSKELRDKADNLYPPYAYTAAILQQMNVPVDFESSEAIRYTHRTMDDCDLYFVSNRSNKPVTADCKFRSIGRHPELWNPLTGEMRLLPEYHVEEDHTVIPIQFDIYQSYFVVFRTKTSLRETAAKKNFPESMQVDELKKPWTVSFDPTWGGPEKAIFEQLTDWSQHHDPDIKYYSGTAIYRQSFDLPSKEKGGDGLIDPSSSQAKEYFELGKAKKQGPIFLDLGKVKNMARIRLNGHDLGVVWTAPWRVDITKVVKEKSNELEIEVINLWPNRLIGDEQLPDDGIRGGQWPKWLIEGQSRTSGRYTFTTYRHFTKDSPLLESGLIGPVTIWASTETALSPGYPERSHSLDVLPGFKNPPSGYGEVPFWWWSGDDLNVERMTDQIRKLHRKGVSGVQVNYSHLDTPGWLSDQDEPGMFTDKWWEVYAKISEECAKLNMGIGMSTYTIDWPQGAPNLFYRLFYHKPELNAHEIRQGIHQRVKGGQNVSLALTAEPVDITASAWANADDAAQVTPKLIAVWAYPVQNGHIKCGGMDVTPSIQSGRLNWTVPNGEWEIREYLSVRKPGSMNPLLPDAGETIIKGFYQQFQDHAPGRSSKGLNYFFNDELHIGLGKYAWCDDFADEYAIRKGYNLFEVLPAMWEDIGDISAKVRMDYADVRMSLMEERYFKPIYDWHASRGMIFACDQSSRGTDPSEFGDYFRATRWYSAPGHDTPGGKADLIKGKVSSSIANLYQRPRVWLEGYHSLGWGATPGQLMFATRENYLYGCNLLCLHGLYYATYGSFWEWAPPCYHFRMPYWDHIDVFLGYFDRLSYLMSQGHQVCDVAIVYPVAPYEAEMEGTKARNTAFECGRNLMAAGINFEFIDHESLARAVVEEGILKVKDAGAAYKALIFPDMQAVRWSSMEKAAAFTTGGGLVYVIGSLPTASDRAGANDSELSRLNKIAFPDPHRFTTSKEAVQAIGKAFVQDVTGVEQTVRALHRKAGYRDVYMVMDASPGSIVQFRAKGAAELWDPWTGNISPLHVTAETPAGMQVELPLQSYEAHIVVFTPGKQHVNPPVRQEKTVDVITLPQEWTVGFIPTMDNSDGDFRLPVTEDNRMIGLEARRFAWKPEDTDNRAMLPATDDSLWENKLHGFGTQFYILGPIPPETDIQTLEDELAQLQSLNLAAPVYVDGTDYRWRPYDFSWRWGKEDDPGHQGWHGLKKIVTDDFICIGKPQNALNETTYLEEIEGGRYFLWSTATVTQPVTADILYSTEPPADNSHTSPILTPSVIYVNGKQVMNTKTHTQENAVMADMSTTGIQLETGSNPLLVRYDKAGRGHMVIRRNDIAAPPEKLPLSMRWTNDKGVIPFDVTAGKQSAEWFHFVTAPGTCAIKIRALGKVEAWLDGVRMKAGKEGRFVKEAPSKTTAGIPASAGMAGAGMPENVVTLRIVPDTPGLTGGGLIPEPVTIETNGKGTMHLGDWATFGILNNYSGGVCYATGIKLDALKKNDQAVIDLGEVAGTAEVTVNGSKAGVKVAPPWKINITSFLKKGDNRIEVLVYNTLANHYQTIPSRYRGNPVSGLLGPVKINILDIK